MDLLTSSKLNNNNNNNNNNNIVFEATRPIFTYSILLIETWTWDEQSADGPWPSVGWNNKAQGDT